MIFIQVIRGQPDDTELAALVIAVLTRRSARPESEFPAPGHPPAWAVSRSDRALGWRLDRARPPGGSRAPWPVLALT
jgi:Acyl-CoA carboxylase epsilon subunit